jgi:UTP--glucose-1-phosphate uridylyltransferase
MHGTVGPGRLPEFFRKMAQAGLDPLVMDTFAYYYQKVLQGETGLVCEVDIDPVAGEDLPDARDLTGYTSAGKAAQRHAVRVVLNGGLGTGMGLTRAKSLLVAKNGKSFLEIIVEQARARGLKLCFMNSFNTHEDTVEAVARICPDCAPLFFVQHKFPKILRQGFAPASWPQNPSLEWNPPGHGDVYTALYTSGVLQSFLDEGIYYALISNSDNLGGTLDETLLGYFTKTNLPFMMEVAQRSPSDTKGGHLARHKNGRLVLREIAQCPEEDLDTFQDIGYHRFFNTNNIWVNLIFLKRLIEEKGIIRLPMILNPKTLDPRDEASPSVFQIETAMGSAVLLFEGATAVTVPATRLFPVKTCNDLLAVRSDRFILATDSRLVPNPESTARVFKAVLDPRYYGNIDLFNERFSDGIPSLKDCESLTIDGDVHFQKDVTIKGRVVIRNRQDLPAIIRAGALVDRDLRF